MKRFVLSVSLLAVLLAGSIGVTLKMQRIHRPISDRLYQAAALSRLGDADGAENLAQQAKRAWQRHREFTSAFADQNPMEEIDELFGALEAWPGDSEDFGSGCLQLAERTRAMAEAHLPVWWNLL